MVPCQLVALQERWNLEENTFVHTAVLRLPSGKSLTVILDEEGVRVVAACVAEKLPAAAREEPEDTVVVFGDTELSAPQQEEAPTAPAPQKRSLSVTMDPSGSPIVRVHGGVSVSSVLGGEGPDENGVGSI